LLEVIPSTSEIVWGDERETLQPRVMQVLVALAARRGSVVSQDDLIATCWDGRIVGEDAIQRCIARTRQLAKRTSAFTVETIPRIGYRLDVAEESEPTPTWRGGRLLGVGLMVTLSGLLVIAGVWKWRASPVPLRIEVMALQSVSGGAAAILARGLQGDIVDVLNQSGVQTAAGERGGFLAPIRKADLVLKGSVAQAGKRLKVHMLLEDVGSGLTLWSGSFERDARAADLLADEVAVAATETIYTILEPNQQKGLKLNPEILALHVRGSDLTRSPQFLKEGRPREIFEQIVARAPNFAAGHALLAVALVNEARREPASDRQPALFARARQEANAAIRIDPYAAGAAYDALYLVERTRQPRQIVQAEEWLLEGLRRAPDFPFLSMRECRLLSEVGRARDAIPYCQRALALRPLAGPIGYSYARALSVDGASELADEAIERAAHYNPSHASTRWVRFDIAAFGAHPERASGLLHDPATHPPGLGKEAVSALDAYLLARRTSQRADIDRAISALRKATTSGSLDVDLAVQAFVSLGHVDDAYEALRLPGLEGLLATGGVSFLFEPVTAPMRADPRFWPAVAGLGIAQHWVARGKWPDLCGREIALATCKAETQRALAALKPRVDG
jgi:tetratricopeptide (TPR) repeat protein